MRTKLVLVCVLLAGSVLLNFILLRRSDEPPPQSVPHASSGSEAEIRDLRERLERAKAELTSIKQELARPSEAAPAAPPKSPEPEDRVSLFRHRLRSLYSPQRESANRNPAELARESELRAEFHRMEVDRQQDPATYGKCLAACLEQILEDLRPPLDPISRESVAKLLRDSEKQFAQVSEETTAGRIAAELRLQGQLWGSLKQVLSRDQAMSLDTHRLTWDLIQGPMGGLTQAGPNNPGFVASVWGQSLQATPEQIRSFEGQARFYVETLERLEREAAPDGQIWGVLYSQRGFDLRARVMQSQAEALKGLTPYLTSDQLRQLRAMVVREFLVYFPDTADK